MTIEEMINGAVKNAGMPRICKCKKCKGSGLKEGAEDSHCQQCNGKGMVTRVMQIGPGMISQQTSTCNSCGGKGQTSRPEDKCKQCNGGKFGEENISFEIKIERGFKSGDHQIIHGMSDDVDDAENAGDLYIVFHEEKNEFMSRNGDDLVVKKDVLLRDALCGMKFLYKHPNGTNYVFTYSNVLKPGECTRVNGLGFYNREKKTTGDLVFQWNIVFPDTVSDKKRAYLSKLLPAKKERDLSNYMKNHYDMILVPPSETPKSYSNNVDGDGNAEYEEIDDEYLNSDNTQAGCQTQ